MADDAEFDLEAFAKTVMGRPDPLSPNPPWVDNYNGETYQVAAEVIAKAMVLVLREQPELLKDKNPLEAAYILFDAVEARWPGFDAWTGGTSGLMVVWAAGVAKRICGLLPVPNPAILTVGMTP